MFKNLDLYTQRYIQIVIMIVLAQAIYLYSNIPHSVWIVTSIGSLYSGFNPSEVVKRAYHRIIGTLAGIALVVIIWYLVHWDYRLLIIFTTLGFPLLVFCGQLPYHKSVILATVFADLMVEWSNSSSFPIYYYIIDRIACTFIIFALCITIEHFWFGRQNLSYLNAQQIQKNILKHLRQLYTLSHTNCSSGMLFKLTNALLSEMAKLNTLATSVKYEGRHFTQHDELEHIIAKIKTLERNILSLNYLCSTAPNTVTIYELKTTIELQFAELTALKLG